MQTITCVSHPRCAPYASRGKRNSARFGSKSQIVAQKYLTRAAGRLGRIKREGGFLLEAGQWGEALAAPNFSFAIYVLYFAIQVPYRKVAKSQRRHSVRGQVVK